MIYPTVQKVQMMMLILKQKCDINVKVNLITSHREQEGVAQQRVSFSLRSQRMLGDGSGLDQSTGWLSSWCRRREGARPSTGFLQPSDSPEGSPGSSCPGM